MKITELNFIQELTDSVTEMVLIVEELKTIDMDTPITHDQILRLNGRYMEASEYIVEIIQ